MKKIKYSCEHKHDNPSDYKVSHPSYSYPVPKLDTYFWHIVNFPENKDKYKLILVFEKVFKIIQRTIDEIQPIGQILHFESTNEIEKANFIFSFGEGMHNVYNKDEVTTCPADFDGKSGVLAHAFDLKAGKPYGGQIHLDLAENWDEMFSSNGKGIHLLTVVLHELLHGLGLGHSTVRDSVMYPTYNGEKSHLRLDDKLGLKEVFQPIKKNVKSYLDSLPKKENPKDGTEQIPNDKGNNALIEFIKEFIIWLTSWLNKKK